MKVQLTLSEKIRDMRDERKLKLQDVSDATGISLATLGRIESNDDSIVSIEHAKKTFSDNSALHFHVMDTTEMIFEAEFFFDLICFFDTLYFESIKKVRLL